MSGIFDFLEKTLDTIDKKAESSVQQLRNQKNIDNDELGAEPQSTQIEGAAASSLPHLPPAVTTEGETDVSLHKDLSPTQSSTTESQPLLPSTSTSGVAPTREELPNSRVSTHLYQQKCDEVAGLTKVWNETREDLKKVRRLLATREEAHRLQLQEADKNVEIRLAATSTELTDKVIHLEAVIGRQQEEVENLALVKQHAEQTHLEELKRLQEAIQDQRELNDTLQAEINSQRAEMDEAKYHAGVLQQQLSSASTTREKELEELLQVTEEKVATLQRRERELEETSTAYINDLVLARKELAERSTELARLSDSHSWSQADFEGLKARIVEHEQRLAMESNQARLLQEGLNKKISTLLSQTEFLTHELDRSRADLKAKEEQIALFEQSAAERQSLPQVERENQTEIQLRVQDLNDRLLQKVTELENITRSRASLMVQIDTSNSHIKRLEMELARVDQRREDLELGLSTVSARRGTRNGIRQIALLPGAPPMVRKAVDMLDHIGHTIGLLLRQHPFSRVIFGGYMLLLHLYIFYVLYYHLTTYGPLPSAANGPSLPFNPQPSVIIT